MSREIIARILDLARWAPSGDNTQPWQFEVVSRCELKVYGSDTRAWCVYDIDGHASHLAHGALLETLRIAASGFGARASWELESNSTETDPIYRVQLDFVDGLSIDPLFPYIKQRTVQRRGMGAKSLTLTQRGALRSAVGDGYDLIFFDSLVERFGVAKLLWANANIRLTCPEAFEVHRQIIEWGALYSKDRIPEEAVGVGPFVAKLMKWVMRDWKRVDLFNRYLFGTILPRIQLDFLPALRCSSHLALRPLGGLDCMADYVKAGIAMQRIWLTATSLGLHIQPEMTPVIFRWYVQSGRNISVLPMINAQAVALSKNFEQLAQVREGDAMAFLCRIGQSPIPRSRSLRKDLSDLIRP